MIPNSAEYFLCRSSEDYKLCHKFLRDNGSTRKVELGFPTVVAVRDIDIIGLISRHPSKDMVIIGTLALANGLPTTAKGIITIRLVEAIEIVMRDSGIKHYWVSVDSENEQLKSAIERAFLIGPHSSDKKNTFYQRTL